MKTERRMTPTADIKVETRDDGRQMVTGYAAVFHRNDDPGTQYSLAKDFVERIAPSAFNRALADKHDARALFNHDPNHVLGRVGAGTLRLSVDNVGLRYEIDLPDTTTGTDVGKSIARGDLTGSSFAFRVTKQNFEKGDKFDVRNIEDVDLLDVGPVTYPAYKSTTTGIRSGECEDAFEARDRWAEAQKREREFRFRELELDMAKRNA